MFIWIVEEESPALTTSSLEGHSLIRPFSPCLHEDARHRYLSSAQAYCSARIGSRRSVPPRHPGLLWPERNAPIELRDTTQAVLSDWFARPTLGL